VLATPDQGTTLVALDARNGAEVASFDLPEGEGKLYGSPLVTPDGKIVVARQKYEEAEASLMILDLSEPPKPSPLRGSGI
jgi:hypothetical protein